MTAGWRASASIAILLALHPAAVRAAEPATSLPDRAIPLEMLRSGSTFQSAETQTEQKDLTLNPGMLWVDQGGKLWDEAAGAEGRSCASCHGAVTSMRGVATRYPLIDRTTGRLFNVSDRIRQCRTDRQKAPALAPDSDELLSLTAVVNHQSLDQPIKVEIDGAAQSHFDAGRTLYYQRQGQLNLACSNCHEQNWGKRLRNELLSQGHPNGYPTYRLEWQTLGSLERRLKACFLGVRAEPFPPDSEALRNLELFLAWRAEGLRIETPAIRR